MPSRALTMIILVSTVLGLSACGIDRRQDRREERREDRKDLVPKSSQAPAAGPTLV
jgi:uncharacterized lipoprotein